MPRSTLTIDLDAIAANVAALVSRAAPAQLAAVVKADGYGHGAVAVGRVALGAGAAMLAVAQVDEARHLRASGIDGPILVLSEPSPAEVAGIVALGLEAMVYSAAVIDALDAEVTRVAAPRVRVHLKIDTGMQRVGAPIDQACALAQRVSSRPGLELAAVATHLAVADEPRSPTTDVQLDRFDDVLAHLAGTGIEVPCRHAANSAGLIVHDRARYDLVRCGIALYGVPPAPDLAGWMPLRPAMRFTSVVSHVKRVQAGSRISYGHRYEFPAAATVATVPVGYADGVPRSLGLNGGAVLVGGLRRPIRGVVTMDQLMVDVGDDEVAVGDEVVLLGEQEDRRITPDDWAAWADTIGYEIVCAVGRRAERVYTGVAS